MGSKADTHRVLSMDTIMTTIMAVGTSRGGSATWLSVGLYWPVCSRRVCFPVSGY